MRLGDKVAIVTGGGKGIGRAIAMAFAREGATVMLAGRTVSPLEETCAAIRAKGGKADSIPTDVSIEQQVQSMVAQTVARFGRVDVLVNNRESLALPVASSIWTSGSGTKRWQSTLPAAWCVRGKC